MISVVIPTIDGREHHLKACLERYHACGPARMELIVVRNKETCADAWNEGIAQARGDIIHLGADDLMPGFHDWWRQPVELAVQGVLPAPVVRRLDGSVESCGGANDELLPDRSETSFTRVPILTRSMAEEIGHIPSIHYYSDNWISEIGRRLGFPTHVARSSSFIHARAEEGRGAGMSEAERMAHDATLFRRFLADYDERPARQEFETEAEFSMRKATFEAERREERKTLDERSAMTPMQKATRVWTDDAPS